MKKLVLLLVAGLALYLSQSEDANLLQVVDALAPPPRAPPTQGVNPGRSFVDQQSGTAAMGEGKVVRLLPDDEQGRRHQRFILALPSGQTPLVAHNIDLAPKLQWLKPGDTVAFRGVYERSPQGGVIHWTHRDPSGRHPAGWLQHAGRIYQ